jgi:hypothetical protein
MNASDQKGYSAKQQRERREHPRFRLRVPFELRLEGSQAPIRGATSDLSIGGCYIETMFTFAVGTRVELLLQIDGTLIVLGAVATCDPNVGNGIKFAKLLAEDREELQSFLEAANSKHQNLQPSSPWCK